MRNILNVDSSCPFKTEEISSACRQLRWFSKAPVSLLQVRPSTMDEKFCPPKSSLPLERVETLASLLEEASQDVHRIWQRILSLTSPIPALACYCPISEFDKVPGPFIVLCPERIRKEAVKEGWEEGPFLLSVLGHEFGHAYLAVLGNSPFNSFPKRIGFAFSVVEEGLASLVGWLALGDEKAREIIEQWTSHASIEYATFHVYKVWHENGLRPMQIASRWRWRTWLVPALEEPIDIEAAKAIAREAFGKETEAYITQHIRGLPAFIFWIAVWTVAKLESKAPFTSKHLSYPLTLEGQWELFARFLLRETCQILRKKMEGI